MATNGSVKTGNYDGRYYIVEWTASQSTKDNQSTISWTLKAAGGSDGWYAERTLNVVIAGSTVYSKTSRVERYAGTIASGTKAIKHNSAGEASFTISIEAAVYGSSINCKGSKTFELTDIPRKSTLSVSNGVLGVSQTLTVTRKSTNFTHTIKYTCGNASGTICTKSTESSISFKPPLSLASQNTSGASVSIKYTITTYSGDTSIGSNSYSKTCEIPDSAAPSCVIDVSDPTGYSDTYGGYLKGLSKFKVVISTSSEYESEIASYSTKANGSTYTTASFTTGVLTSSGDLTISTTVKDKRGKTGKASIDIPVLAYENPAVTSLKIKRCDSDGIENPRGENVKVTFDATIFSLSNQNTATYKLEYKKTSEENYVSVALDKYDNTYSITSGTYTFPADSGSSYNIRITATDNFSAQTTTTVASTAFTIMHWLATGFGIAFGKIAELTNVLDIGFQTRFMGGILHPILENGTDLNDVKTPNTYVLRNLSSYEYPNCPLKSGTCTLYVDGAGDEGQVKQRVQSCSKAQSKTYERFYYQDEWGEWICVSDYDGSLLWQGGYYMQESHNIALSEPISRQKSGIVLVFSAYVDGEIKNYHFASEFVPKYVVQAQNGGGHVFNFSSGNYAFVASKYLYIYDSNIKGHEYNVGSGTNNGITYNNKHWILRYVIGV